MLLQYECSLLLFLSQPAASCHIEGAKSKWITQYGGSFKKKTQMHESTHYAHWTEDARTLIQHTVHVLGALPLHLTFARLFVLLRGDPHLLAKLENTLFHVWFWWLSTEFSDSTHGSGHFKKKKERKKNNNPIKTHTHTRKRGLFLGLSFLLPKR